MGVSRLKQSSQLISVPAICFLLWDGRNAGLVCGISRGNITGLLRAMVLGAVGHTLRRYCIKRDSMNESIVPRLRDAEDGFTERKTEGAANASELRKTLVAFANAVPEGKTAILFVGVNNEGTPTGIGNIDSLQKTLRQVAEKECYPPIKYQTKAFESDGKMVLAVLVEASKERPHFSGPAFFRVGSESVIASPRVYEELIASRNTKAGKIIRNRDQVISFRSFELDRWGRKRPVYTIDCRIEECDAHVVSLVDIGSGRHFSVPLESITINLDQIKQRMMLEAPADT